ncbi:hypothetical protein ACP4OV_027303 [Aristida adscensionis]
MKQAHLMPQPNESHLHKYHVWDMGINALQIPTPHEASFSLEGHNFSLIEPSQNHANTRMNNDDELSHFFSGIDGNIFSASHTFTNDQWPSVSASNEPYYDSLHGLDVQMGYLEDIGGHATNNVPSSSHGF